MFHNIYSHLYWNYISIIHRHNKWNKWNNCVELLTDPSPPAASHASPVSAGLTEKHCTGSVNSAVNMATGQHGNMANRANMANMANTRQC